MKLPPLPPLPDLRFVPTRVILALHSDGITLTGAVFRRAKGLPEELGRASVQLPDPAAALAELVAQLRAQSVVVPRRAILATDRAAFLRADLPVHPDRPRPYAQMRELARWEAEIGFADLPGWESDTILRAMGAIRPDKDARIREEIDYRSRSSSGANVPRYHDAALTLGLIDRATRDRAIEFRERLATATGEAGCGWIPVETQPESESAQHGWLLSALPETERAAWRGAARSQNITLLGILPAWGLGDFAARHATAAPGLPTGPVPGPVPGQVPPAGRDPAGAKATPSDIPAPPPLPAGDDNLRLLLERHSGALALLLLEGTALRSIRIVTLNRPDSDEATVLHRILDGREQGTMTTLGLSEPMAALVRASFPQARAVDPLGSALLLGAAARGLALPEAPAWPALIAPEEPNPPPWKSENFLRFALLGVVLAGVLGFDLHTRWHRASVNAELARLEAEYERKSALAREITSAVNATRALETQLTRMQAEVAEMTERERAATYLQGRRQAVVEGLLSALQIATPQGVVIRRIEESRARPEVFTLSAWSVSDILAEQFIARLNASLTRVGLAVAEEQVVRDDGLQGMIGYSAHLRIMPVSLPATTSPDTPAAPPTVPSTPKAKP